LILQCKLHQIRPDAGKSWYLLRPLCWSALSEPSASSGAGAAASDAAAAAAAADDVAASSAARAVAGAIPGAAAAGAAAGDEDVDVPAASGFAAAAAGVACRKGIKPGSRSVKLEGSRYFTPAPAKRYAVLYAFMAAAAAVLLH